MHIREKSDIFGSKVIFWFGVGFMGQKKTPAMFMISFGTKHRLTNISGLARGNSDFYLHCFGIFYVHVRVSK